jgi:hypothetical protein
MALFWVRLTARDIAAADGFRPDVDRSQRLRMLLDGYAGMGGVREVLAASRQRALDYPAGLRAAAEAGWVQQRPWSPKGVAHAFDRGIAETRRVDEGLAARGTRTTPPLLNHPTGRGPEGFTPHLGATAEGRRTGTTEPFGNPRSCRRTDRRLLSRPARDGTVALSRDR